MEPYMYKERYCIISLEEQHVLLYVCMYVCMYVLVSGGNNAFSTIRFIKKLEDILEF